MTKIDSKVQKLRTKMRFITDEFPDRNVTNDSQYFDLYLKLRDLIEELDYKVDIADCISALHDSFEDLEMYE
jgi:hypothetical protein|tara:strand:- start:279 stop:494 length:216 start_codon:yes stop_codon:yes gene_type:complete